MTVLSTECNRDSFQYQLYANTYVIYYRTSVFFFFLKQTGSIFTFMPQFLQSYSGPCKTLRWRDYLLTLEA